MRKTYTLLLTLLSLVLLGNTSLVAQDYPTDTIKGKVYYKYAVQQGEGLFRISQNFNVSQEDIIKCNPELKNSGLKRGQVIYIPYVAQIDSAQYIVHELMPKETLYGLSKKYGVSIKDIESLNPESAKRMAIGDRLLIARKETMQVAPVAKSQPIAEAKAADTVRTEQEVIAVEPPEEKEEVIHTPEPEVASADTVRTEEEAIAPTPTPLRIAFLLPLMTDVALREPSIDRFVEFYEGALLALEKARDNGQKFEVYVYDTEKNTSKLSTILAQPEWLNMDAIIGPAYPSQVSIVSQFAYQHQIPTVIPFTYKVSDLERNPYLIQCNPSNEAENEVLIHYIQSKHTHPHCVFVQWDNATNKIKQLHTQLQQAHVACTTVESHYVAGDSLVYFLRNDAENILIFPSEKYSDNEGLFQYVTPLSKQGLSMLSFYTWQEQTIPLPSFYTAIFHDVKSFSLDKISYDINFGKYFGNDITSQTPRYDYLGYDITRYTIQLLQQKADGIGQAHYEGLQSDFQCVQVNDNGGYENRSITVETQ